MTAISMRMIESHAGKQLRFRHFSSLESNYQVSRTLSIVLISTFVSYLPDQGPLGDQALLLAVSAIGLSTYLGGLGQGVLALSLCLIFLIIHSSSKEFMEISPSFFLAGAVMLLANGSASRRWYSSPRNGD